MDIVRRCCASGSERSCSALGPAVNIALCVADNGLLSGCTGRSVNSDELLSRHGKKSERIVISEILFYRKGQLADIVYRMDIFGLESYLVKLCLIKRDVFIASFYRLYQPCALHCVQIIARRRFNFGAEILCHRLLSPLYLFISLLLFQQVFSCS